MPNYFDQNANSGESVETPHDDALWVLLSVYADGEATPEEAAQVEAMLRSDPAYARELTLLRRTAIAAREFPELEPPATLRDSILSVTSHRPTLTRRVAAAWQRLGLALTPQPARLALAGGLCAAALGLLLVMPGRDHTSLHTTPVPNRAGSVAIHIPARPDRTTPVKVTRGGSGSDVHLVHADTPVRSIAKRIHPEIGTMLTSARQTDSELFPAPDRWNPGSETGRHAIHSEKQIRHQLMTQNEQKPRSLDQLVSDHPEFSPAPMMDQKVYKNLPDDGEVAANASDAGNDGGTPPLTSAVMTTPPDGTQPTATRVVLRVTHASPPPPDTRRFLSTADIRRELAARTMGFSTTMMDGIRHREATISVLKSTF